MGLNRNGFSPLYFVQVQGMLPLSFRNMELNMLSKSKLPSHQNQNAMLTSVQAVGFTLLNNQAIFIGRLT